MKEYNIKVSVRNNKLLNLMRINGIETAAQLSRCLGGYNQVDVGRAINLKSAAYMVNGRPYKLTVLLCDYFNVLPEDLFPHESLHSKLEKNTSEVEVDFDQMISIGQNDSALIAPPTYEESALPLYQAIDDALLILPDRTAEIVKYRFGIDGYDKKTYKEMELIFGISMERIRQIEAKALRIMRHPQKNGGLSKILVERG